MAVKAKPDGYHTITSSFVVNDAERFKGFVESVLGAREREVFRTPDGRLAHAELEVGDSVLMVSTPTASPTATPTETPTPGEGEPMSPSLYLYLDDCDGTYRKAIQAGATSEQEPSNQFWGDRIAGVRDPWGNRWYFATHIEDVAPDEMQRRGASMAPA